MPVLAAVIIFLLCTLWLFARDRKLRPMTSWALWVPLLWIMIIGSRSISLWTGERVDPDLAPAAYLEGSPVDRNIFLLLIIAGLAILWRRRIAFGRILSSNRCIFAYFLYFGVSIVWSDYPFVSLKGWIKEMGNVVMVLILITESDSALAIKAVFSRYSYVAIPLSALLITYFPDLGSYYSATTSEFYYCGVTMNKNELGQILVVAGLFLVSDLVERLPTGSAKRSILDMLVRVALLAMVVWLLLVARSSTSIASVALGSVILFFMRFSPIKKQIRYLGMYSLWIVCLVVFVNIPIVLEMLVELLGRDMTFTGRTEIWQKLLEEPINPLLGSGFRSFWLAPGIMESYGFINQAHNGYLEIYLNGGWLGLFFLLALIISVGNKLKNEVLQDKPLALLLFAFLVVNLFVNVTEAMFDKLNLIWFLFLVGSMKYQLTENPADDVVKKVTPLSNRERVMRSRALARCGNGR